MKRSSTSSSAFTWGMTLVVVAALAFALAGCSLNRTAASDGDQASDNRQYMASLNQQMSDLQTEMDAFQKAVAAGDVVSMRAQQQTVDGTITAVKAADAPERLQSVKDNYVDALDTLDGALDGYVSLYSDVQRGAVSSDGYDQRLSAVQDAYNSGIEKVKAADAAVSEIASE